MNTIECIKSRRSIRTYNDNMVDIDTIKQIIDTVRYSPSWKNTQTPRYIAVMNKDIKDKIAESSVCGYKGNENIIKSAPVLIIETTLSNRSGYDKDGSFSTSKGTHFESFDAGVSAGIFTLVSHEQGLSTVIMGIFDEDEIRKIIDIPTDQKISSLISLGYSDIESITPKRKEIEELLTIIE